MLSFDISFYKELIWIYEVHYYPLHFLLLYNLFKNLTLWAQDMWILRGNTWYCQYMIINKKKMDKKGLQRSKTILITNYLIWGMKKKWILHKSFTMKQFNLQFNISKICHNIINTSIRLALWCITLLNARSTFCAHVWKKKCFHCGTYEARGFSISHVMNKHEHKVKDIMKAIRVLFRDMFFN